MRRLQQRSAHRVRSERALGALAAALLAGLLGLGRRRLGCSSCPQEGGGGHQWGGHPQPASSRVAHPARPHPASSGATTGQLPLPPPRRLRRCRVGCSPARAARCGLPAPFWVLAWWVLHRQAQEQQPARGGAPGGGGGTLQHPAGHRGRGAHLFGREHGLDEQGLFGGGGGGHRGLGGCGLGRRRGGVGLEVGVSWCRTHSCHGHLGLLRGGGSRCWRHLGSARSLGLWLGHGKRRLLLRRAAGRQRAPWSHACATMRRCGHAPTSAAPPPAPSARRALRPRPRPARGWRAWQRARAFCQIQIRALALGLLHPLPRRCSPACEFMFGPLAGAATNQRRAGRGREARPAAAPPVFPPPARTAAHLRALHRLQLGIHVGHGLRHGLDEGGGGGGGGVRPRQLPALKRRPRPGAPPHLLDGLGGDAGACAGQLGHLGEDR